MPVRLDRAPSFFLLCMAHGGGAALAGQQQLSINLQIL